MSDILWHIWAKPAPDNLENLIKKLNSNDSLIILSAEEAYYPVHLLIEKTIPLEDDWPSSFGNYTEFQTNLKKLKSVDIILGTDDPLVVSEYSKIGKVHPWANFFLYRSVFYFNRIKSTRSLKKLYISLNTRAHYHRCLLMDLLVKHNLYDQGIISWHHQPSGWKDSRYVWKFWKPEILSFDKNYDPADRNRSIKQHTLPVEIDDAFLMLISETVVDYFFVTEKTWHAILAEKPFIVFGCKGFHKKLENMGFELYNDVIDYSFDQEENFEKRAEMIMQELCRLRTLDFFDLEEKIISKLKRNKDKALEIVRQEKGIPALAKKVDCYSDIVELKK